MPRERDPRPALALFYAAYFANLGIFLPFLPPWLREQGLAPAAIGALLAVQPLAKLAAPWTWGRWADRASERRLPLAVALVGAAAALAALGALRPTGLAALFAIVAVYAVGTSPSLPYAEATSLEQADRRGFAYGPVRLWGSIAFIVASGGFGLAVDRVGEPNGFLAGAALLVVAIGAVAAWPAAESPSASSSSTPRGRRRVGVGTARLFAACAAMQASHGAYYAFYSIRLRDLGMGGTAIGALWALGVACEVAILTRIDTIVARLGPHAVLRLSLAAAALRWAWIARVEGPFALAAAQVLHALTYAAFHVAALREVHARFPAGRRATAQASYSGWTYGAGTLVGTLAAGAVVETAGIPAAFLLGSGVAAAGIVLLGPARGPVDPAPDDQPS